MELKKIVVICGPTGVGKSLVALKLAQKFNGEIVNADSAQVYIGMDTGTAKPTKQELALIPHHLIDVLGPDEHFDAAVFVKLADDAIKKIHKQNKLPFIVGGTGMYLRMLIHGICAAPPQDANFRKELEKEIEKNGLASLHERLKKVDPHAAETIHQNDRTRIIRALEIFELTGIPSSNFLKEHGFAKKRYEALKIGLNIDREKLYEKIDARVDLMIKNGWIDEIKNLMTRYSFKEQAFSAIGYRELAAHINGDSSLEDAIALIKRNSRRYAKRQLTWFKADKEIAWYDPEEAQKIAQNVSDFLSSN